MARKKSSPILQKLAYWCARAGAGVLAVLPLPLAVKLGQGMFLLLRAIDGKHRRQCEAQIRDALKVPPAEAAAIAKKMYLELGCMLAEFARIPGLGVEDMDKVIDWGEGERRMRELNAKGCGAIYATGHIGNWELCGNAFAAKKFAPAAIARPLDNPYLNSWIVRVRSAQGLEVWEKFGAMRQALKTLKHGSSFGILMDIAGGRDGVRNTFFGLPCSTLPTPADLAARTGAYIMPVALRRVAPMRFRFVWAEPFAVGEGEEERLRALQRLNDALEGFIREEPAQWLWLHRRWKLPPEKKRDEGQAHG